MKRIFCIVLVSFLFASPSFAKGAKRKKVHHEPTPAELAEKERLDNVRREMNRRADDEGISRVENDQELKDLQKSGELVPLPANKFARVNGKLKNKWRFVRPWVKQFLLDFGEMHYQEFGRPIQINSAVRTVQYEKYLERHNKNADPAEGDTASLHIRGIAVDLAKKKMRRAELLWMRRNLFALEDKGIFVKEEFHQAVFHIVVFKTYGENQGAK